jgi:soluble lytic murein transglycosylase-like protein
MSRAAATVLLAGALAISPCLARATDLYTCKSRDDVLVMTNDPSRSECRARFKATLRASPGDPGAAPLPAPRPARAYSTQAGKLFKEHVSAAARYYQLPEALLEAVMAVESNFNPVAMSSKGAAGLMQLMPDTAKDMYVRDVWSPEDNIYGGARYLRVLANQYQGDVTKMLAAYNAGPEAVRRAGGRVPRIAETEEYVRKVLALYQQLKIRDGKG